MNSNNSNINNFSYEKPDVLKPQSNRAHTHTRYRCHPSRANQYDIFELGTDRSILENIAMILQYLSAAPRANFPAKVFPEFNFELRRGEKSTSFNTYVHKQPLAHVP